MRRSHGACVISLLLMAGASLVWVPANAEEWPQAWFEPMRTASEADIRSFGESPVLADRDLPPVRDRLPADPPVVVPLGEIGQYGGTVRITRDEWLTFPNVESPLTISADMRTILPNLAQAWDVSPDGKRITFTLREGIKWSDGVPLTSDDFLFVFNDLWLNKEFAPVTNHIVRDGRAIKLSDRVFYYEFPRANPLIVNWLAQYGNFMVAPKHFYRHFHPTYVERDVLAERIKSMGHLNWMTFIETCRRQRIEQSVDAPVLDAFKVVEWSPTMLRYERNPYYFKVDPEGNQLPYIDAIESHEIQKKEVIAAMTGSGQLDFAAFELKTQDIPLLKLGERSGAIKLNIWNRLHSSDVVIQMNYNYPDERFASLFRDLRFRKAMSVAINRDEMNEIIYFGRGTPRQVTVHPTSDMFEPHFATAYTEYDPNRATRLFDELGLKDVDGDGLREFPDGSPLVIALEYIDWETPKQITLELVSQYWREVGIDLRLKMVDRGLQSARALANRMQMTVWHADRVTDILMPVYPNWFAPIYANWDNTMWNLWSRWYLTDGELGEEPPPEMQQLQRWVDEMSQAVDVERRVAIGKKILQSNAENLWSIGTIGLAPQPVAISTRLRGVPEKAVWGWDNRWTLSYHPATWWFDERTP